MDGCPTFSQMLGEVGTLICGFCSRSGLATQNSGLIHHGAIGNLKAFVDDGKCLAQLLFVNA